MRDLTDEPAHTVAKERSKVTTEGWGARLLALQDADGQWDGGTYIPAWAMDSEDFIPAWTSTTYTLLLLRELGLDPTTEEARRAISLVRDNSKWEEGGQDYFEGEVEPCINSMAIAIGAYFGEDVAPIIDKILAGQLSDGGWNCWAEYGATVSSFHTTLTVLEGLLAYERATGGSPEVTAARMKGQEYLLARGLLRRLSSGELIDPAFSQFSYPTRWKYDVLRALDYFRDVGGVPDDRLSEALDVVKDARGGDGRWLLQNTHEGAVHFVMEDGDGQPSRWNTLRAMRVLDWAGR